MSPQTTVHVSNIAPATTDSEIKDFFILWYVFLESSTTI